VVKAVTYYCSLLCKKAERLVIADERRLRRCRNWLSVPAMIHNDPSETLDRHQVFHRMSVAMFLMGLLMFLIFESVRDTQQALLNQTRRVCRLLAG